MSAATCLPGESPAVWSARVLAENPRWAKPHRVKRTRLRAMELPVLVAPVKASKPAVPHCVYCGWPSKRKVACHAHADLPALDPFFSMSLSALSVWAPVPERKGQEVVAA